MRNMELKSRRRASCEFYYLRYRTVKLDKMKEGAKCRRRSKSHITCFPYWLTASQSTIPSRGPPPPQKRETLFASRPTTHRGVSNA